MTSKNSYTLDEIIDAIQGINVGEIDSEIVKLDQSIVAITGRRDTLTAIRSLLKAGCLFSRSDGRHCVEIPGPLEAIKAIPSPQRAAPASVAQINAQQKATRAELAAMGEKIEAVSKRAPVRVVQAQDLAMDKRHRTPGELPAWVERDSQKDTYVKRVTKYLELMGPARPRVIAGEIHTPLQVVQKICDEHPQITTLPNGCCVFQKD